MKNLTLLLLVTIISAVMVMSFTFKKEKKLKPTKYMEVPSGKLILSDSIYNMHSFSIAEYEVSNKEYNKFLQDFKLGDKANDSNLVRIHSENWRKTGNYNEPYVDYYDKHPAYDNYPVLNISYKAAQLYCKWLTSKSEDTTVIYRLPTKKEWIYAAKGGLDLSPYAWGGPYIRDEKGNANCNFFNIGDEHISRTENNKLEIGTTGVMGVAPLDVWNITTPVNSYKPNKFGLYNVCGNAAEMIQKEGVAMGGSWYSPGFDVQVTSEMKYTGPSPYVGFRIVKVKR